MRVCGHQNRELLANLVLGDPGAEREEKGRAGEQQDEADQVGRQQEGSQEELGVLESQQGVAGGAARASQQGQGSSQPLERTRLQTTRARAAILGELEPG